MKGKNSTEKKQQLLIPRNESRTRYDVNWIFDLRFNRIFPFKFFVLFLRWGPGFLRSKPKFLLSRFELCGLHCIVFRRILRYSSWQYVHRTRNEQDKYCLLLTVLAKLWLYCSTYWLLRLLIARAIMRIRIWEHEHSEPSLQPQWFGN